jgi:hypothetical protein
MVDIEKSASGDQYLNEYFRIGDNPPGAIQAISHDGKAPTAFTPPLQIRGSNHVYCNSRQPVTLL